jgi:predicted FMN-binding regulatory protein PaiB/ribosomal protein S18 acetylase RimI-like enzyme
MRKEDLYGMARDDALALLRAAPTIRLAATDPDGRPVLRTLNFAILEDRLWFHGAPAGEKTLALGREAVLAVDETVASIPSWFVDAERACPATMYYRSVQAHGVLEREDDPERKAAALRALMAKHQPEGRHVPIDAAHPLYRKAIEGLLVVSVRLDRLHGKAKLGQNRTPTERARVLDALWRRGAPGDARACALVLAANPGSSRGACPEFLAGPEGVTLVPHLEHEDDVTAAVDMLVDLYWNRDRFDRATLETAHRASSAWVGARDALGRLVASARAISDGAKHAWVYDVVVDTGLRGSGVGDAVMRLLLEHPAVRGARFVHLQTRDAQPFYGRMGFRDVRDLPPRPYASTTMTLTR